MPAISVIATVLNEVEDIDGLVSSLVRQTLAPAEIIVVDGGSTDGTWERLQASALAYANLKAIQDPSCSLKESPGPIARGRNVAIAAASSEVIACADAGCVYGPDWLERLTEPIRDGEAEYALGGSCLDADEQTTWDIASAPFLELSWIRIKRRRHAPLVPWPFGKAYGNGSAVFLRRVLRKIASSINASAQSYSQPSQNAPRRTIGLVIP